MENLTEHFVELIRRASTDLPADVEAALRAAQDREAPGSAAAGALGTILENVALARTNSTPVCQDTGTPIFYVHCPQEVSTRELRSQIEAAVAEATGQDVETIVEQLQAGQTPREVLALYGADATTFVNEALDDLEAHLAQAVADDRIDQARADEILANAETRLNEAMDRTFEDIGSGDGPRGPRRRLGRGLFGKLMEMACVKV